MHPWKRSAPLRWLGRGRQALCRLPGRSCGCRERATAGVL